MLETGCAEVVPETIGPASEADAGRPRAAGRRCTRAAALLALAAALAGTPAARAGAPEAPQATCAEGLCTKALPVFEGPEVVILQRAMPACRPAKPAAPEQALVMDLTGTVHAEYTVYEDGHVGAISLAGAGAPAVLGRAVERWLSGCLFTPFVATVEWGDEDGPLGERSQAVPVKIVQSFVFKRG